MFESLIIILQGMVHNIMWANIGTFVWQSFHGEDATTTMFLLWDSDFDRQVQVSLEVGSSSVVPFKNEWATSFPSEVSAMWPIKRELPGFG